MDPCSYWLASTAPLNVDYDISGALDLLIPPASLIGAHTITQSSAVSPQPENSSSRQLAGASPQPDSQTGAATSARSSDSEEGHDRSEQRYKPSGKSRYTTALKLERNREAQRRFRLKQKARSQNIQAQLADTAAKVEQLEQQKHQLEASNVLLRQSSPLLTGTQAKSTSPAFPAQLPTQSLVQPLSRPLPQPLSQPLSQAHVQPASQTVQPASQTQPRTPSPWEETAAALPGLERSQPHAQLSAAWTDRIHQMGSCLLQMDGSEDPSVHVTLQSLTTEAMTLVAQLVRTHGKVSGPIVHNGRAPSALDDPLHGQPDEAFYCRVLANMHLSDDQAKDLLFLRRIFLTRRCVSSMDRKALINQLAATDGQVLNPTENIRAVEHLFTKLRENAAEDHELYYKVARAMFRGVLGTKQVAEMMVHAYPFVNVHENLLESLATKSGDPSKDSIVMAAQTNHMAAEYAQLMRYCEVVGNNSYPGHLPLWSCIPAARG